MEETVEAYRRMTSSLQAAALALQLDGFQLHDRNLRRSRTEECAWDFFSVGLMKYRPGMRWLQVELDSNTDTGQLGLPCRLVEDVWIERRC